MLVLSNETTYILPSGLIVMNPTMILFTPYVAKICCPLCVYLFITIHKLLFYLQKFIYNTTNQETEFFLKNTIKAGGSTARAQNVDWVMDG